MNRRQFFRLAALSGAGRRAPWPQGHEWPDPEKQNPSSSRGRGIAEIARSIAVSRDIPFAARSGRTLLLDVYAPRTPVQAPLPAILRFGVAAWRTQTKAFRFDLDHILAAPTPNLYAPILVPLGYVVISAECRVASEARFPAQLHDCQRALDWVRANASRFSIDVNRIGVMGASASGHLASLLALTDRTGALRENSSEAGSFPPLRAAYSFAGLYDFEYYVSHPGDRTLMPQIEDFLGGTFHDMPEPYRQASPIQHLQSGGPAFLLMHGKQDRRVPFDQSPHFVRALKKAGVAVNFQAIDHYVHGPMPG